MKAIRGNGSQIVRMAAAISGHIKTQHCKCGRMVFPCKHCGSVGCDRSKKGEGIKQLFHNGTCQKCDKVGAKGKYL